MRQRVSLVEALGLRPFGKTAREMWLTLGGDRHTPRARFDLTSLRNLRPRYAVPLWLGRAPEGRRVPITNLYNYRQPDPELGWSVRVTDVCDFRGGRNTYDSHNGTDLAIPPGTRVVAGAPAVVLRVSSEFNRGGRKVFLDHGRGLVTSYNHLCRPLVRPGQRVARGEAIALSGYSGVDGLVAFPWAPPHVHMNVWLNCEYVDPFSRGDEPSIWRVRNDPAPARGRELEDRDIEASDWDEDAVERALSACSHDGTREEARRARALADRAGVLLMHMNYYPTRFRFDRGATPCLHRGRFEREPRLDLPFSFEDYEGVVFPDL